MTERAPEVGDAGKDKVLLRAVRSLAWNRQLQPIIEERLDRAESIVRSQLLSQGGRSLNAGPFEVSLNEDQEVLVTWQGDDNWQQHSLPDVDPLIGDPLDNDDNEPL